MHKIKSRLSAIEAASVRVGNPNLVEWLISNEAADAAAGISADHLEKFDAQLKKEEFVKAQLWSAFKRISAIELHIRNSEEDLRDIA